MSSSRRALVLSAVLLTLGCAGHRSVRDPAVTASPPREADQAAPTPAPARASQDSVLTLITVASPLDTLASEIPDIPDSMAEANRERVPSEAVTYDIPIELNRRVLTFVEKNRDQDSGWFARAIQRSGRYLPMIQSIFEEEGVPKDLAYMALVESGYRHNARSRAGAIGMWQFMRATARRYGLLCTPLVDERLDPERATRAAARYLRDLHDQFDDWYLAMAAYNAGEGKVDRAIRRAGTRDFWELARTRHLVRETQNYVPAILAAIVISKSLEKFGFEVIPDSPIEYEKVEVGTVTHLDIVARCCDVPSTIIRSLNPALISLQTPPGHHPYEIRIPAGSRQTFLAALDRIPPDERMLYVRHQVKSGDSLSALARRYGTSVGAIQQANRLGRRTLIRAGQTLQIPTTGSRYDMALAALAEQGERVTHKVRRGETVGQIARAYGTSVSAIQVWNNLSDPNAIREGQSIAVYVGVESAAPLNRTDSARPRGGNAEAWEDAPEAGVNVHTVASGESLWAIARHYGVGVDDVRRMNPDLQRSTMIRPGDKLLVPRSSGGQQRMVHRVARGETLWEIADRYGISVAQLRAWNGMTRFNSLIRPGDSLTLYR